MSRPASETATSQLATELMRLLVEREQHYADLDGLSTAFATPEEYRAYESKLIMKYLGREPRSADGEICRVLRALEGMLRKP